MAIFNRFFCWPLQTASFVGYIFVTFTSFFALVLRLIDVAAIFDPNFEISQGFQSHWRSHGWDGFVVTDILMVITHTIVFLFSIFLLYLTTRRHFIMTISWSQFYLIYFILYVLCELACSLYEFAFYGVNTFRLAFVVFIWLYWLVRTLANTVFAFVLWARYQEMNESMDKELKFAGERRNGYI
ncbi:uncharacterized protein LOC135473021 [Liolophura sinensis]|uniref:uncharacterized protein LOC135473021 n=1 Tax=Liolophura sinensis TaxID=3198878 RepID=UPI00315891AE